MFKNILICLVTSFSSSIIASPYVSSGMTKIIDTSSYNSYGNGDVLFKVNNPIDDCSHGYWITKSDAGYEANISMILAAYQAKNSVVVYALPEQLWAGSSGKYCKLYSIHLK